jgi:hypothetical protein
MNEALSPTIMREISFVTKVDDPDLAAKLQRGLEVAIREVDEIDL